MSDIDNSKLYYYDDNNEYIIPARSQTEANLLAESINKNKNNLPKTNRDMCLLFLETLCKNNFDCNLKKIGNKEKIELKNFCILIINNLLEEI